MESTNKIQARKHVDNIIDTIISPDNIKGQTYSQFHKEEIDSLDWLIFDTLDFCRRLFKSEKGYESAEEEERMPDGICNSRLEEIKKHKEELDGSGSADDFSESKAIKFLREEAHIPGVDSSGKTEFITKQETLFKIVNPRVRAKKAVVENYVKSRFPDDAEKQNEMLRIFGYCIKKEEDKEYYKQFNDRWNTFDCCCSESALSQTKNFTYNSRIQTIRRLAIVSSFTEPVENDNNSSEGNYGTYSKARDFLEQFYENCGFSLEGDKESINSIVDAGDSLTLSIIKNNLYGKMYAKKTGNEFFAPFWYYIYVFEHLNANEFSYAKGPLGLLKYGFFKVDTALKVQDSAGNEIIEQLPVKQ